MTAEQVFAILKNKIKSISVSDAQIAAAIEKYLDEHPEYKTQSVYEVARAGGYSGDEEGFPAVFAGMLQLTDGNEVAY